MGWIQWYDYVMTIEGGYVHEIKKMGLNGYEKIT